MSESTRQTRRPVKETSIKCPLYQYDVFSTAPGPTDTSSFGDAKCFVTLLDEYSAKSMVRFVRRTHIAGVAVIDVGNALKNKFNENI